MPRMLVDTRASTGGLVAFEGLEKGETLISRPRHESTQRGHPSGELLTSFILVGAGILRMAMIFAGFASMPRLETMNSRNFPEVTPKAPLAGLRSILA